MRAGIFQIFGKLHVFCDINVISHFVFLFFLLFCGVVKYSQYSFFILFQCSYSSLYTLYVTLINQSDLMIYTQADIRSFYTSLIFYCWLLKFELVKLLLLVLSNQVSPLHNLCPSPIHFSPNDEFGGWYLHYKHALYCFCKALLHRLESGLLLFYQLLLFIYLKINIHGCPSNQIYFPYIYVNLLCEDKSSVWSSNISQWQ